ncbi:MAG: serine/threonine protein kinase [Deltaproteobacteria bacterium]|nr:serine/threonine protein kinase [Deltaproteobacteria bacterium]
MSLFIDRYQVKRLIGQGSMGRVYLGFDPKVGRQVAIKVLTTNADEEAIRRFRLEARAIAALKHPNIVELYDFSGEKVADLFLVMEYVSGPSLDALVRQNGNTSEPTALCIGHELCLALTHAHNNQIVHRDIKPENVLLHQGRVVLSDFGIVKAVASSSSLGITTVRTQTRIMGTPGFMAPEQFSGKQIDHRTDIFSLGALLYCITTGKLPFEGRTVDDIYHNLKNARVQPVREINPLLSPGFADLVERCLDSRPKARPQSAQEVRAKILAVLPSHGVTEVRQELALYEANPAGYAIEQRQRSINVLLRDLKVALKDRDHGVADSIMSWLKTLAPLDKRLPSLVMDHKQLHKNSDRFLQVMLWIALALLVGVALGALGAAIFDLRAALPRSFISTTNKIIKWLTSRF